MLFREGSRLLGPDVTLEDTKDLFVSNEKQQSVNRLIDGLPFREGVNDSFVQMDGAVVCSYKSFPVVNGKSLFPPPMHKLIYC